MARGRRLGQPKLNPQHIAPRPDVKVVITVFQIKGFEHTPIGNLPITENPQTSPAIDFTSGFASHEFPGLDPGSQYLVSAEVPGGSSFIGNWNDEEDVVLFSSGNAPISVTDGQTTLVRFGGELSQHHI
jgi:hypothetical protein